MTLVTTYYPSSWTSCPTCEKLVSCQNIGGITFGVSPYLDFYHPECGTKWRYHLNTNKVEFPIPIPICGYCGIGHTGLCENQKRKEQLIGEATWLREAYARLDAVRDNMRPEDVEVVLNFLETGRC